MVRYRRTLSSSDPDAIIFSVEAESNHRAAQCARQRCTILEIRGVAAEPAADESLAVRRVGEGGVASAWFPASCRSGEPAVIKFEFPLENLIKTMRNSGFLAVAGLQFLAGVKECG